MESWSQYLMDHRDEIAALQVLYAGPKGRRPTFVELRELDNAPFTERGGTDGALFDLGDAAADYLDTLNTELTA